MTTCPVCGESLIDSAIRCRGCSVIVGAPASERRFAPKFAPSPRHGALGSSPAIEIPSRQPIGVVTGVALFAAGALATFALVLLAS